MWQRVIRSLAVVAVAGCGSALVASTAAGALDNPDYTAPPPSTVFTPPPGSTLPGSPPSSTPGSPPPAPTTPGTPPGLATPGSPPSGSTPPAGGTPSQSTPAGSTPAGFQPTGIRPSGSSSEQAPVGSQPVRQPEQRVATEVVVRPLRSRLAITGSDVAQAALVGLVLVGLGAAALVLRRRTVA